VAAGFFAAAAPDLDFVLSYAGPVVYLLNHRGVTHSLLLLPLWALLFSWILAKLLREPGGWRALYGVTAMSLGLHVAGDVITSFGTMVFAPFSDWRAGIGTTFIIDLWFTGIILAGLTLSAVFYRSMWPAAAASVLLVGYVALQAVMKHEALELGSAYAKNHGLSGARITAHPRPISPFNWTVFVSDDEAHRFAHVNLIRKEPRRYAPGDGFIARLDSPYLPLEQAIWVTRSRFGETPQAQILAREVWALPELEFYRWFADLPAFDGMTEGSACVWFADLRFVTPGRDWLPFRFGACRSRPGTPWRVYERTGETTKLLLN
jgi:inner membrane protein